MSEARLKAAREAGGAVGVKFEAAWCADCVELNRALETAPLEDLTLLVVDTDDEDSAPLVARLAILELPTFVWLDPDGERGRVVGFGEAGSWWRELDAVRAGRRTFGTLTDPLERGEVLLSLDPEAGLAALEVLCRQDDDAAAEALHRLGRYHQRAQRDPDAAKPMWRDLFLRFEDHPRALGALIWYARAEAESGHAEQGGDAFKVRHAARPRDAAIVLAWAAFAAQEGLESQRAALRDAAMKTLTSARGADRDRLENLVMELALPFPQKPAS